MENPTESLWIAVKHAFNINLDHSGHKCFTTNLKAYCKAIWGTDIQTGLVVKLAGTPQTDMRSATHVEQRFWSQKRRQSSSNIPLMWISSPGRAWPEAPLDYSHRFFCKCKFKCKGCYQGWQSGVYCNDRIERCIMILKTLWLVIHTYKQFGPEHFLAKDMVTKTSINGCKGIVWKFCKILGLQKNEIKLPLQRGKYWHIWPWVQPSSWIIGMLVVVQFLW